MGSLLVAVFESEAAARAGSAALRDLHAIGAVTLYAAAIVVRRPRSTALSVRDPVGCGAAAAAPAVGAAIGALVTLLGTPLAAASRTTTSGLVGAVRDLDEAGFDAAFLDRISRRLGAGSGAIIAEAEEEQPLALDARILAQGGQIFRHRLMGTMIEERAIRELTALHRERRRLRTTPLGDMHVEVEAQARQERVREFQRLLEGTYARARALRSEAVAKVAVLRAQAMQLEPAARRTVEQRATSVRSEMEARAARLERIAEEVALPADQTGDS